MDSALSLCHRGAASAALPFRASRRPTSIPSPSALASRQHSLGDGVALSLSAAPAPARTPSRVPAVAAADAPSVWGENPHHEDNDYIVLGLAQCFVKDDASKLSPVQVIEPVPAGAVECMDNGGVTSYLHATATTLGVALKEDPSLLPPEFAGARFAEDFAFRAKCAARTWMRQHAVENLKNLVPAGVVRSDFNFSTEDKRVLNLESEVTDDDNIKQDISIDVYGRSKDEPAEATKEIEKLYNA